MINQWAKNVIRYRVAVILISIAVSIAGGYGLKNLYFESSTDLWFLKDDPVLLDYKELKDQFGSDDYLVVGIEAKNGDLINQQSLQAIKKISDFLEEHAAVNKVRSLSKFEYIYYNDGLLDVDPAIPESDDFIFSGAQIEKIKNILKNENIAHDLLFTKDLRNSIISARVVMPEEYTTGKNPKIDLATDFRNFIVAEGLDKNESFELHYSGSSIISEAFFFYSTIDQSISYPLMMTFILIFLYLIFRTAIGVALPFGIVVVSSILTLGVIGYSGWSMNMMNIIIPTILTVIGLGNSVHVLMGFYEYKTQGLESPAAAEASIKKYLRPCFYTYITTFFGFLALTSSKLALVVEFGLEMLVGLTFAFIFSLTTLPAILSYSRIKADKTAKVVRSGVISKIVYTWPAKIVTYRKIVLIATCLLVLPSVYFISKVEVDTNFVRNFKEDAPVRKGLEYFDQTYKGALSLEFMLDSKKPEGVKDPAFLQRALEFQEYVTSLEGTGKATSVVNYLMKINQVMHDDNPEYFRVPETRNMVGQYLLLYSSSGPDEDLTDLMNFSAQHMRISVLFAVAPSKITKQRVEQIEAYAATHFADLNIKTSGRAVLFNNMDNYVLDGLISSFFISLLLILISFFVLLRSIKYGLMAMIPNLLPILMAGAVMGIFNIYLDFATLMIAATTLGIAVDDTIHFMSSYVKFRRENSSHEESIVKTFRSNGPAIISTSTILIIGFGMLTVSSFVPNIFMGIIGAVVIAFALIAELILLPALIPSKNSMKEDIKSNVSDSEKDLVVGS